MKVRDCMTRDVRTARPDQSLREVALEMLESDIGVLPVEDGERLIGMITDRDIATRAVAMGLGPDTKVRNVMSKEVLYCFADHDIDDVAENMADIQVRRLPVVDNDKRLVGLITIADLVRGAGPDTAASALSGVNQPGGQHTQTTNGRTSSF
jgi:CBS domain-containing protein